MDHLVTDLWTTWKCWVVYRPLQLRLLTAGCDNCTPLKIQKEPPVGSQLHKRMEKMHLESSWIPFHINLRIILKRSTCPPANKRNLWTNSKPSTKRIKALFGPFFLGLQKKWPKWNRYCIFGSRNLILFFLLTKKTGKPFLLNQPPPPTKKKLENPTVQRLFRQASQQ